MEEPGWEEPGWPRRALWRRPGPVGFVPPGEVVHVDTRQHPAALVAPVLRTLALDLLLLTGAGPVPLLVAGTAVVVWARHRLRASWQRSAVVAAAAVAALLWLAASPLGWALALVATWLWLADDALNWWNDRLVVTDKRVYRRYGWVTEHAPSMALYSAVFVDVVVSPLDRALRCGTLQLDSVAQRDAPLARFPLVPDVRQVHHTVLELRARSPRPTY